LFLGVFLAGIIAAGVATAQQNPFDSVTGQIEIVPVRGHMYMLTGAGANIVLSIGPQGVFMVDTGLASMSTQVLAVVNKFSSEIAGDSHSPMLETREVERSSHVPPKPIQFIANTTIFPDHIGGNEKIAEAGKTFTGGNVAADLASGITNDNATIFSTEKALLRMSEAKLPGNALPSETYNSDHYKVSHFFNGEGIELMHMPDANTDGDSIVVFRGSDVIATGDIFSMASYPVIDIAQGGSIQGELAALNRLIDLSVAEYRSEGGTLLVPSHGRIGDLADLTYYRDMCTIIRDRIQDMVKAGKTLDQIKAAKPTGDWDVRFGKNPLASPDRFVEAIYKGLTAGKAGNL
jgi:glyoxylase-like metal-dependent hydrolase (beta-lactamase superfamily II)